MFGVSGLFGMGYFGFAFGFLCLGILFIKDEKKHWAVGQFFLAGMSLFLGLLRLLEAAGLTS